MAWFVLIASGAFESVWAIALSKSDGFTRLWPSVTFALAVVISMGGLAWAMKSLPVGTAYAVWDGVGASLTIIYSFATGAEAVTMAKLIFLWMIIAGIIGLKVVN